MIFYIFHRHTICLVDCVDLICSLHIWWEGFGSPSLATLPLGFFLSFFLFCPWVSIVVVFPPPHVGCPLGVAPEAALDDLGLPL